MTTIEVELSESSIDAAIKAIEDYEKKLKEKTVQLVDEAASSLKVHAVHELSKHINTGETISSVRISHRKDAGTATVSVGGEAVWLEFGTGVVANGVAAGAYTHPKAAELGMYGIGEYGHGHGADPNGWWYYDATGHKHHTNGIPATMFMYHSAWDVRREIPEMARRIFR